MRFEAANTKKERNQISGEGGRLSQEVGKARQEVIKN